MNDECEIRATTDEIELLVDRLVEAAEELPYAAVNVKNDCTPDCAERFATRANSIVALALFIRDRIIESENSGEKIP